MVEARLLPYLIATGLLSAGTVTAGRVRITRTWGRSGGFLVEAETPAGAAHTSFFIKGALRNRFDPALARETLVYQWLWETFAHLPRFTPRSFGYDQNNGLLISSLAEHATTLHTHLHGSKAVRLAATCGSTLAHLHQGPWTLPPDGFARSQFDLCTNLTPLPLAEFHQSSAATLECIRIVQSYPELWRELDALRSAWEPNASIHGDLRGANILIGAGRTPKVWLVDWELAGPGDAAWDLACFLANYLIHWIETERPPRPEPARAFWSHYAAAANISQPQHEHWLTRIARFLAVRLVQNAIESSASRFTPPPDAFLSLQLAQNLLREPRAGLSAVLGL